MSIFPWISQDDQDFTFMSIHNFVFDLHVPLTSIIVQRSLLLFLTFMCPWPPECRDPRFCFWCSCNLDLRNVEIPAIVFDLHVSLIFIVHRSLLLCLTLMCPWPPECRDPCYCVWPSCVLDLQNAEISATVETPYSTIPYTTIFDITRWAHGPQNLQRPIRTLIVLLGFRIK